MDGIVQFIMDRIKYYETVERTATMFLIEDLNLIIEMLKKSNGEKLKPGKKPIV